MTESQASETGEVCECGNPNCIYVQNLQTAIDNITPATNTPLPA